MATNQVIAVREFCDTRAADLVIRIATHKRIEAAHFATHATEAIAPGCRTAVSIPSTAHNHKVAVSQLCEAATADPVTWIAAN